MTTQSEYITVEFSVPVPMNVSSIDALAEYARRAALSWLAVVARVLQEARQRADGARLERRGWRERTVLTPLGEATLEVLKVRDRATGRGFTMLNEIFELRRWQRTSNGVGRTMVESRVAGRSYRQAARAVGGQVRRPMSPMRVWRLVQRKGKERIAEEARELASVEAARSSPSKPPDYLYLEPDEIHVKAQRSGTKTHRVKVGLSYTGRQRVPGRRTPRRRLVDKQVYGGVESVDTFGLNWYASLERRRGVSEAPAILFLADPDPMLWGLRDVCFPQAVGQLDRAHLFRDFQAAAPNDAVALRWRDRICEGKLDLVRRNVRAQHAQGRGNPDDLEKVWRALHHDWIEGWKQFRDRHDPGRTQRIPKATGGIEKNQEVLIGRAMKRRGMAWSANGANHLVKLIFAYQDKETWNNLWKEPVHH